MSRSDESTYIVAQYNLDKAAIMSSGLTEDDANLLRPLFDENKNDIRTLQNAASTLMNLFTAKRIQQEPACVLSNVVIPQLITLLDSPEHQLLAIRELQKLIPPYTQRIFKPGPALFQAGACWPFGQGWMIAKAAVRGAGKKLVNLLQSDVEEVAKASMDALADVVLLTRRCPQPNYSVQPGSFTEKYDEDCLDTIDAAFNLQKEIAEMSETLPTLLAISKSTSSLREAASAVHKSLSSVLETAAKRAAEEAAEKAAEVERLAASVSKMGVGGGSGGSSC